jgi:aryl-alcohol dehydrogenase-like predicted oxidoreductase
MAGHGFGPHDERESLRVLYKAAEQGITHFDTAGFYGRGMAERLICNVVKHRRKMFFVAAKGGLIWNGQRVEHRASPYELKTQLYESLERLDTDYLDLYQLHWPDPQVPVQESILAMKEFQRQGLIRSWGVCNLTSEDIEKNLTGQKNIPHQVHFNPIHRNDKVLAAGQTCCINCIISPLEQGLLGNTKSSLGKTGISKKDFRNRNPYFSSKEVVSWNNILQFYLSQSKLSKVSLILMWICSQPYVHVVVPGPRTTKQLDEILCFINTVECNDFLSSKTDDTILSTQKVRAYVSSELWVHLCQWPTVDSK